MILITKHGREYHAPASPTYYSCTCPDCECEFEFDNLDLNWTYDMTTSEGRPAFYVNCPECNKRLYEWCWRSETEG